MISFDEAMMMVTKVKDWYINTYPSDEMGNSIKEWIRFHHLLSAMNNDVCFYKFTGVNDSIVRERIFGALAEIMGVDYDYIYDQWLLSKSTG